MNMKERKEYGYIIISAYLFGIYQSWIAGFTFRFSLAANAFGFRGTAVNGGNYFNVNFLWNGYFKFIF